MHGIQKDRFKALQKSYRIQGIEARLHGNLNRLPFHGFTTEEIGRITTFLDNFSECHAIILPGRIPGYKNWDVQLLPTQMTKKSVWLDFVYAHATLSARIASYRSFCRIWEKYRPSLLITKPKSDLCWECQQNSVTLTDIRNKSEEEKIMVSYDTIMLTNGAIPLQALEKATKHVSRAKTEREHYKAQCDSSTTSIKTAFTSVDGTLNLPAIGIVVPPASVDITMHISFDYAQQLHYPSNPLQPGPIYFLTPRKCGIFGVCVEAIPMQINYLIDEAVDTGKGSNSVISYLHHFFSVYSMGSMNLTLHADNCSGQNKNNIMMQV